MSPRTVAVVLCLASLLTPGSSIQCMTGDSTPRKSDWWFVYKQNNGFDYAYYDELSSGKLVVEPDSTLENTKDNSVGGTLHQLYGKPKDVGYLMYNDEDPITGHVATGGAHAKGVLAIDSTGGGFFMIHSVPKFPDLRSPDFTWKASTTYGQTFLCITLDKTYVEVVAKHLQLGGINVFDSRYAV